MPQQQRQQVEDSRRAAVGSTNGVYDPKKMRHDTEMFKAKHAAVLIEFNIQNSLARMQLAIDNTNIRLS